MEKAILPEYGFTSGFLDRKGILWFGSGEGLYKYDGEIFSLYGIAQGLKSGHINCIYEDVEGRLWLGTKDGVNIYDEQGFRHLAIPRSDTSSVFFDRTYPIIDPNEVLSIVECKRGDFWFGTNGAGVYKYDGKEFTQYLDKVGMVYEDSVQHNIVVTITEDHDQNLWFTSLSHGGITRYDGKDFRQFTMEDGLSDNFIRTSFCDSNGNVWIGSQGNREGALDRYDGTSFTSFRKRDDGIFDNNVRWIHEDKEGTFWIGSGRTNLCVFDGKHFMEFESAEGEKYEKVLFVIEDSKGNIWFGSREGLWKYDGEQVVNMSKSV